MSCQLCEAIRNGMQVTDETPLPCRLRPGAHHADAADPFHGAVFSTDEGHDIAEIRKILVEYHQSTTPEQRAAQHAPHVEKAAAHLASKAQPNVLAALEPHPLDALGRNPYREG